MKKVLILMLVLGMATMASAALTGISGTASGSNTEGAGSIAINVTGGNADTYLAASIIGTGSVTTSIGAGAPSDSILFVTMADAGLAGTYGQGDIWAMADGSVPYTYTDGVWLDVSYIGAVAGDVITFRESDGGVFGYLDSVTIVPEPMTIALLGLGGLFLRRRK